MPAKQIIMCPPEYYDIEYSINPWMDTNNKVKKKEAQKQYNNLKEAFRKAGAEINELTPVKNLPDMVFACNAGYAESDIFVKANFKAQQRKREAEAAEKYFKQKNYRVFSLPENIIFEGEGDIIRTQSKYFLGWGQRSDLMAKDYIEDITGKEFIPLELIDPYFYHLDTCFGPINDELVVINEKAFSEDSLTKIYDRFQHVISANETDNSVLACNLVVLGKNVFIGKGTSEELKNEIRKFSYNVIENDMSEFLKGGGSVKCLSLEIF